MIAEVVVPYELNRVFDYDVSGFDNVKPGMRVVVNFANRRIVGYVINLKPKSFDVSYDIKSVLLVLDSYPSLSSSLLKLSEKISQHYFCSQGKIVEMMLPRFLRESNKQEKKPEIMSESSESVEKIYIQEQLTGTRRFDFYAKKIMSLKKQNKKTIVVVSSATEVDYMHEQLSSRLENVDVVIAQKTTKVKKQYQVWQEMFLGEADVCIGTRAALFAPFSNIGLMIVDTENAYGHLSGQSPYYHARDIALFRAKQEDASVILHSDFPSLEVSHFIEKKKLDCVNFLEQNKAESVVYDLNNYEFKKYPIFSEMGTGLISNCVEKNKKVLVFWNRKGFSNLMRCSYCKELLKCSNCDSFMRYEKDNNEFVCGKCLKKVPFSSRCSSCGQDKLKPLGVGVQRVEENLKKFFPTKKIHSLSTDHSQIPKDWDIIVSTQKVLEAGINISADLVVVSGLDSQVSAIDYYSSYHLFLLLQRLKNAANEKILLFTLNPEYYPFQALKKGADVFYKKEIEQRSLFELPPYSSVITLVLRTKTEKVLTKKIRELFDCLDQVESKAIKVYGPLKEAPYKLRNQYYMKIILKAKQRNVLYDAVNKALESV